MSAILPLSAVLGSACAASVLTTRGLPDNFVSCLAQKPTLSCENRTAIANTCCSPTPGGLVLATQFWDTYTGVPGQLLPRNHWTIHGLWPDNCDGSYASYCDFSRQYDPDPSPKTVNGQTVPPYAGPSVRTFIEAFRRYDLLAYMDKYWIAQGQPNDELWAHEFSKHATCFSTFDTKCYPRYQAHEDVVDFYDSATRAFRDYPTYDFLAAAGITPSNTTTYTLAAIQAALKKATGATPYVGCYHGAFDEVWYYSHSLGPPQLNLLKHIDSTTPSSCPATGIYYYERTPGADH